MSHSATGNSKKARSRVLPTGTAAFCYAGNIIHLKTRAKTSQLCTDINHPQHREAYLKRVPFSIQNAGASKADIRLYGTRTRSGHITHLQPCAATHEKPAPRELHPVRTRKEETFTPDCLHQQIFTGSICQYRSVSQNGLRSFAYRNATHPQSVSVFLQKNISKRLSDNHKNHYLCIHNHSTASLKRRSEAHIASFAAINQTRKQLCQ